MPRTSRRLLLYAVCKCGDNGVCVNMNRCAAIVLWMLLLLSSSVTSDWSGLVSAHWIVHKQPWPESGPHLGTSVSTAATSLGFDTLSLPSAALATS